MTIKEFAEKYLELVRAEHNEIYYSLETGYDFEDAYENYRSMYEDLDRLIWSLLADNGYSEQYEEAWEEKKK